MHPVYAMWWAGLMVSILAAELIDAPDWVWGVLLGAFMVIEALALRRRQLGDTFSELMWVFKVGGSSRGFIAVAMAIYLPLRFAMIGLEVVPLWVPRAVLAIGFIGWLIPHLYYLGRKG